MSLFTRLLSALPSKLAGGADLQVVVETPAGARNKYKYEEGSGLFTLHKVLPAGAVFPYDFGFIPSTKGEDGDPLDVLLLLDAPTFTGCIVQTRLLGAIEAEQTSDGGTERNDRLIGVATCSRDYAAYSSLKDLGDNLLKQIEHFFASYNAFDGRKFKVIGRSGPSQAHKLVEEGMEKYSRA